ncbi:DUF2079 domain-containing protein [Thermococcus pacificus]|uniref:DUF2079 domain-containing protein n=1 Tax=Thermococcus pacificus TaxID=71998 RepID=A0A218P862_9EURY|nr:DUF2079 domain-containing protein [Thermococcus pacificus]ASJ06964.1 hypothetical protein A3L08_06320 [Thermococcus pacificus]
MRVKTTYSVWGLILSYSVLLSIIAVNRHYTFRTNAYDLGIFMQAIWSTANGFRVLYNTIEEYQVCVTTHLGVHFSPILLVLVPIYKVFPHAETLLIIQTFVIALSAYPLFLLSKKVLHSERLSLAIVVLYLMNSLLHGINGYDFHATPFALPFIFMTALYFERGEYRKALVSSFFVLLVKEDAGLSILSLSMFYLLRNSKLFSLQTYKSLFEKILTNKLHPSEKTALIMGVLATSWVLISWRVIIPHIAGVHITSAVYYARFPCVEYIPMKILYFIVANLTLGLLTFLRPKYTFLLTFAPWLEILLSCEKNLFRIGFQYPYMILPLSLISVIYTIRELQSNNLKKVFAVSVLVGILFSILTTPILPLDNEIKKDLLVPPHYYQPITHHDRLLLDIIKVVDSTNFSVLTQNDIFPHLANRISTYVIWSSYCGNTLPKTDIILLDNTLLYSVYNYRIKDHLRAYTKVYENDGIEVWIRNDVLETSQATELVRKLQSLERNGKGF